jgi:NAD+ kinase
LEVVTHIADGPGCWQDGDVTTDPTAKTRWRIALVMHPERTLARDVAQQVRRFLESRGHEVVEDASLDGPNPEVFDESLDLAVALGGDGTMLRTAHAAVAASIPVLGVNLGTLGYLTEVEPTAVIPALERILSGDYMIDERMTLDVSVEAGGVHHDLVALNDAGILKTTPPHTIRLHLSVGSSSFLSYVADGFLVSSPAGSTAYNLSLRGPILSPKMEAIVLTPIAPHMLFDRSLVLSPDEEVGLELLADRPAALVVDGRATIALVPGDIVKVRAGKRPARFITFETPDFYGILRAKFGLTDR